MHKLFSCIFLLSLLASTFATEANPISQLTFDPIINPQCKVFFKAIGDLDDRDPQIKRDKAMLAQDSGHNINDLGNYGHCTSNSSYIYLVAQVSVLPENATGYVGICSPSYCSAYDWGNESTWLQGILPTIGGPNLTNYTVTFIDPDNLDIHASFGSYLSVFIVLAFLGLTIAGTFFPSLFAKGEKNISPGAESHYIRFNDSQNFNSSHGVSSGATSQFFGLNRIASGVSSMNESKENIGMMGREEIPRTFSQRIFQSFDASRNYDELVGKETRLDYDKNLHLWDGIKFFAMFFVILGNIFLLSGTTKNAPSAMYFAKHTWWALIVSAAAYALDIFLFVSGFIAAYQLLEQLKEVSFGFVNLLKVYFHRWIRLWPTYVIVILLFWKVAPFLSSGPAWFQFVNASKTCDAHWWKNFLLIDNLFGTPVNNHCMPWGLSATLEMQMFLFTPFVIWAYIKDREYGKTMIWILVVLSVIAGYAATINSNFPWTIMFIDPKTNMDDIFNQLVTNPMTHWCCYFIGIYAGILYRNYKNGERNFYYWIRENWKAGYIITTVCLISLFLFLIILPRTEQQYTVIWPQSVVYGWVAAGRMLVCVCLWLVLVPAMSGYMKGIKNFLSWGIFKMVSNVIYPMMLVNFIVILYIYSSDTQFAEFSMSRNLFMTFTVLMVSLVIGTLLHLVFERPLVLIAKGMFVSKRNRFSLQGLDDANSLVKA